MKSSGIGGQAVIEGVMMKNKDVYAVAVRKPDHKIAVDKRQYQAAAKKYKILALPILRGITAFAESLVIGMRTLTFSASYFEEEEETKPSKMEVALTKVFKEKAESVVMGFTVILAVILAVGIFMMLPYFAADFLQSRIDSPAALAVIEGVLRLFVFIGYVIAISQMKDIKRVFMYHGAEHKVINCVEHGKELTVKNVKRQSRQHKRCGTSFLLFVMLVSIVFFSFIRMDNAVMKILLRLLLVPVIAGVAYELIRFAGNNDWLIINVLSKPGLWLQNLTTREPDEEMIEVAIASVEAVFDWRAFLKEETQEDDTRKISPERINEQKNVKMQEKEIKLIEKPVSKTNCEKKEEILSDSKIPENDIAAGEEDEEDDEILKALDQYFKDAHTGKEKNK